MLPFQGEEGRGDLVSTQPVWLGYDMLAFQAEENHG
jgi:hypothetical protein